MRMSVRPALSQMIQNADYLRGNISSLAEINTEIAEAREALGEALLTGRQLLAYYGDLDVARESLESFGFSDEWLEGINKDNKFLDAINVDLVNLIGTDAQKADVCLEGLASSVWGVVVRIWQWIVNAVKKLVAWLKRVMRSYRIEDLEKRTVTFWSALMNHEHPDDACRMLGEAINASGGRGGKAFDVRQLIERASVARVICAYFMNSIVYQYGWQNSNLNKDSVTDRDVVSESLLRAVESGRSVTDPIMAQFKHDLDDDQMNIAVVAKTPTEGFKDGFEIMDQPDSFGNFMRRVGYKIREGVGGVSAFVIEPLEGAIDDIDYTKVFSKSEYYNTVFGYALPKAMQKSGVIVRAANDYEVWLTKVAECIGIVIDDLKKCALTPMAPGAPMPKVDHIKLPYSPVLGRALQLQAKFVAETMSIIIKFSMEMIKPLEQAAKISRVIESMKDKI